MKRFVIILLMYAPFFVNAQENKSVHFEDLPGWQQVLAKARTEGKFIFVDMVATWCAPCKMMDKITYTKEKVGMALHEKFIAVKVQVDSTGRDNAQIKGWYKDAAYLTKIYNVTALPTFLFFSPEGKILHRGSGLKDPDQFIALVKEAANPDKQLYTLLEKYKEGKIQDQKLLPELANTAKEQGDDSLANTIARLYLERYLYKKKVASLTAEEIHFMGSHLQYSNEKGFRLVWNPSTAAIIDSTMGKAGFKPNYARTIADNIIRQEEIISRLDKDEQVAPDWKKFDKAIGKKYGQQTAQRVLLDAQINWFFNKKDWNNFCQYYFKKLSVYGIDTSVMGRALLNNLLYGVVFQHVNDKTILEQAIGWMEKVVKVDATDSTISTELRVNNIDTYANLLYKAGRKTEAIAWQENAVKLDENNLRQNNKTADNDLRKKLQKMQHNEPTWNKN